MSSTFARKDKWLTFDEHLMVVFDDGERAVVKDQDGIVAYGGSRWLFEECWKRGWFE